MALPHRVKKKGETMAKIQLHPLDTCWRLTGYEHNRSRFYVCAYCAKHETDINMYAFPVRQEMLRLIRRAHKPCSCFMCCNPRRRGEITLQERKANIDDLR